METGTKIKINVGIAAFVVLLLVAFCQESRAGVTFAIGPTVLSAEYSEGGLVVLSEDFGRYTIGVGLISEQTCYCADATHVEQNIFFEAQRNVPLWVVDLGIGIAYFQNTNRALGRPFNFSLSIAWDFSDNWGLAVKHWSNGGSGPNIGQDALVVQYSF